MLQALKNWWRGDSEEDMASVKDRLLYPKNLGRISLYVTNAERRALRYLGNLRKRARQLER